MRRWTVALGGLCLGMALSGFGSRTAQAAPKPKPRWGVQSKPNKKNPKPADATGKPADHESKPEPGSDVKSSDADSKPEPSDPKAAGTAATNKGAASAAVVKETKEDKEGVKTYKFGTIEVEGRLKSPQIIYFLRRVRAEFDAGLLGHRSFMRELADTRNHPALR